MQQNKFILFLTDIHVSMEESHIVQQYFYEMESLLLKTGIVNKINYLVISGDITCTGSKEEFEKACILLNHLTAQVLHISSSQVYICPGNHDADRNGEFPGVFSLYNEFSQYFHRENTNTNDDILFTTLNSCTQCILCEPDKAILTQDDEKRCTIDVTSPKTKLLMMHHQPEVFQNKENLYSIFAYYDIVLYGHTHVKNIEMKYHNHCLLINGCAFHAPEQLGLSSFHTIEIKNNISIITYQNKGYGYEITETNEI